MRILKNIFILLTLSFLVIGTVSCCSTSVKGGVKIEGTVAVVGNEPFTHLILRAEQGEFILKGEKTKEIWKLQNKTITVCGSLSSDKTELINVKGTITVSDYKE